MKKIYAVNGSPRNNGSCAKILQKALDGAAATGADTELIERGKLDFSGCRSCFACKLKNGSSYGKCAVKDDLSEVLAKVVNGDGIIMASPIYFGAESGLFRCFMERLFFPLFSYTAPPESLAPKQLKTAFVYTMNIPESLISEYGYKEFLEKNARFAEMVFGDKTPEFLYVYDTYQFDDYDRYVSSMFDAAHKAEVREKLFPCFMQQAFELGCRMAK